MGKRTEMTVSWILYEAKFYFRKLLHLNSRKYAGRKLLSIEETNQYLYDKIINAEPFFAGRIGGNEMNMIAYTWRERLFPFRTDGRRSALHELYFGAGFFPEEPEMGKKFVQVMNEAAKDLDLLGQWNRYMEEWYVWNFMPHAQMTWITSLQPWNAAKGREGTKPWTAALKGKKVLAIHPFAETINKQYFENREKLFRDIPIDDVLPEFELKTLKAVQSMGDTKVDYEDWFQALHDMVEKCRQTEFDVAILGCGAYGFPLAAEIKRMGKIAIHLGGVTQLLFGIRGRRWDTSQDVIGKAMNEYWVRPSEQERIKDADKVEGACYW